MSQVIAIVGRPNVGKSALFNRIVRKRIAIVHDEPGVTRDRMLIEAEWQGRPFTLVDTGGIGLRQGEKSQDVITTAAMDQVSLALESASVLLFVVNVQEGILPLDQEVASRLHASGKTILLVANKADHAGYDSEAEPLNALGFERIFPVSAIHGRGIDSLMKAAMAALPASLDPAEAETSDAQADAGLKLAIVGRPNVGKSSIINAFAQSERVIVSPIAGTTRDSVDVPIEIENEGQRHAYVLIDTAGIRKKRRVADSVEFFSVKRAEDSIERCDIAIHVMDAQCGVTVQDKKIAGKIVEAKKACILVINKWDLYEQSVSQARDEINSSVNKQRSAGKWLLSLSDFGQWVQEQLFFMDYAPVIFTSASSGFHLDRLLEAIRFVADQLKQKVPTSLLNRTLHDAVNQRQPISKQGSRLKFYYATQVKQTPPTFRMFLNRRDLFSDQYTKYLAGQMRKAFGYEGCPVIFEPRSRPKAVESIRSRKPQPKLSKQAETKSDAEATQRAGHGKNPARGKAKAGGRLLNQRSSRTAKRSGGRRNKPGARG
ncbi:MAG: ribosome biogenesis GTPase Der [Verrucomicrobiota bacterium]|jgi:GTP-binding protein